MKNMPIAYEVLYIEESAQGEVSVLLSEEIVGVSKGERAETIVRSLVTLAKNQLIQDITHTNPSQKIEISPVPNKNSLLSLRLMVTEEGEFALLTYFGQSVPKNFTLLDGLNRALFIIASFEENLDT